MSIKNILVATDFSEPSSRALAYGIAMARRLRARLCLVHVLAPQPFLEVATSDAIAALERDRRDQAMEKLGSLVAPEDEDDLNLQMVVRTGNPRQEIVHAVQELRPDLVVMGTHGRSGLGRFILGSTAEALLRELRIPVMTVCHSTSVLGISRILWAADLSDESLSAFSFVLGLARVLDAEIVAIHALGGPVLASGETGLPVETQLAVDEARRRLATLVEKGKAQGIQVQTTIAEGSAASEILKASKDQGVDLILLGIERKGFVERVLLGTTAERVIREAQVPVVSVPIGTEIRP